jgi:hypothetical protein
LDYKLSNVRPSKPDYRDYIYGQMFDVKATADTLPSSAMLPNVPQALFEDQGHFGTCVGNATAYDMDFRANLQLAFSRLFIYTMCKQLDGNTDEGTDPRTAMQVLQKYGACLESTMPYSLLTDVHNLPKPTQAALDEAAKYKIGSYARIQTLDEIKHAIANGYPVNIASWVCQNFIHPEQNKFIPAPEGQILGGHDYNIVGYDDNLEYTFSNGKHCKGFVRILNSWGTSWADGGYAWIPYDVIASYSDIDLKIPFMMEAWVITDYTPVKPTPKPTPQPTPAPTPQPTPQPQPKKMYHVQVGSFANENNAKAMLAKLESAGFKGFIKYE